MRPLRERKIALELIGQGLTDLETSRRLGIPRSTVKTWRLNSESGGVTRQKQLDAKMCPMCGDDPIDEEAYSYLLGLYLGDGCLTGHSRNSWKLRIFQDASYTDLIQLCRETIDLVRGEGNSRTLARPGCVEIYSSWAHWICLFPQHGPGTKHKRVIELQDWQQKIADSEPEAFVRGLIHSDGCRYLNSIVHKTRSGRKTYRYPTYSFANRSADVFRIMSRALETIGVGYYVTERAIYIARRADVARLDQFIGPKS